ncbi:MAG: hypothetical protein LIO93_09385 [Bacteroidales bacterium]|nr:hypothetical protein [Bacteroidales bacterium]
MSELFRNKYRIPSARASWWDYGQNGLYFVTICTHERECCLGEIIAGEMILSDIGKIAYDCWVEIPEHFPFVKPDAFVVMPNHVHGIVIIDKEDPTPFVENEFRPQSQNLSSIIRGYKTGVSVKARRINPDFKWQTRYHDHIIRNDNSYAKIVNYIENNPILWIKDKFHPDFIL